MSTILNFETGSINSIHPSKRKLLNCHIITIHLLQVNLLGLCDVHVHVAIIRTSGPWCVHISALNIINSLLYLSPLICIFDSYTPSILYCHSIPAFPLWSSHTLIGYSLTATVISHSNLSSVFSFFLFWSLPLYHITPLLSLCSQLTSILYHTNVNTCYRIVLNLIDLWWKKAQLRF